MRRLPILLVLVASVLAVSCNNAKLIKFADFHYKVSCREQATTPAGGCVSSIRDINNSDLTDNVRISQCRVGGSGAMTSLAFNVQNKDTAGQTFGIQVSGLYFDDAMSHTTAGSPILSGSCALTVTEMGGNQFRGACGPATPSAAIPCRISGIRESWDNAMDMNPQIEGDMVCAHLTNVSAPTQIREVEADSVTPGQAFHFRIVFCDGVTATAI